MQLPALLPTDVSATTTLAGKDTMVAFGGIAETDASAPGTLDVSRMNPIAAPSIGGKIAPPQSGAPVLDAGDDAMSAIAALLAKFEKAREFMR